MSDKPHLKHWHTLMVALAQTDKTDLTVRQMAVLLTIYLEKAPHTVRGLSSRLNIGKPAITRAIDKLELLGYVRRKQDEADRRNVLLERSVKGAMFLNDFGKMLV